MAAAAANRYGHRDATMVLIAFRHGLRPAELVALRWDAVDFNHGQLHVARVKGSAASVHPLTGRELRALRRLKREQEPASPFVFTSERGAPFATGGFRTLIGRLGEAAGFDFRVHPHMLRHACGYKLANDGVDTRSLQAYLGHRNIQHTVRYTGTDTLQGFLAGLDVTVIDLKPAKRAKRAPRDLVSIDKTSGAARFFQRMVRDIEGDLGGQRHLSRIQGELIRAFAGAATLLQYQNVQVALGESSEIDLTGYATIASTMLRIGSRLGLNRVPRDVTLTLGQVLRKGVEND